MTSTSAIIASSCSIVCKRGFECCCCCCLWWWCWKGEEEDFPLNGMGSIIKRSSSASLSFGASPPSEGESSSAAGAKNGLLLSLLKLLRWRLLWWLFGWFRRWWSLGIVVDAVFALTIVRLVIVKKKMMIIFARGREKINLINWFTQDSNKSKKFFESNADDDDDSDEEDEFFPVEITTLNLAIMILRLCFQ